MPIPVHFIDQANTTHIRNMPQLVAMDIRVGDVVISPARGVNPEEGLKEEMNIEARKLVLDRDGLITHIELYGNAIVR